MEGVENGFKVTPGWLGQEPVAIVEGTAAWSPLPTVVRRFRSGFTAIGTSRPTCRTDTRTQPS
jgi:hypothetical protein